MDASFSGLAGDTERKCIQIGSGGHQLVKVHVVLRCVLVASHCLCWQLLFTLL